MNALNLNQLITELESLSTNNTAFINAKDELLLSIRSTFREFNLAMKHEDIAVLERNNKVSLIKENIEGNLTKQAKAIFYSVAKYIESKMSLDLDSISMSQINSIHKLVTKHNYSIKAFNDCVDLSKEITKSFKEVSMVELSKDEKLQALFDKMTLEYGEDMKAKLSMMIKAV